MALVLRERVGWRRGVLGECKALAHVDLSLSLSHNGIGPGAEGAGRLSGWQPEVVVLLNWDVL
eukprot:3874358-Rhodomonas_salina.2